MGIEDEDEDEAADDEAADEEEDGDAEDGGDDLGEEQRARGDRITYGEPEEKDLRVARAVPSAEAAAWAASEAETVPADLGETLSAETLPLPG